MTSRVTMSLVVDCDGHGCRETVKHEIVKDADVRTMLQRLMAEEDDSAPGDDGWLLSGVRDLCPSCLRKRNHVERVHPRCGGSRLVQSKRGVKGLEPCLGCYDCVPLDKPKPKSPDETEPVLTPHLTHDDATAPLKKPTRRLRTLKPREERRRERQREREERRQKRKRK